ncbi:MAG: GAF domain-containing protein [Paludibacter sp.]
MSGELFINIQANKKDKYESLLPQLVALIDGETDLIANLANISAALHQTFGWWWVGFYWVKNSELVLGPFQGPIACTRIGFGKGVCGTAWKEQKSLLVPDINDFAGHISCSSLSVSEIVIPIFDKKQNVVGVLDVDSEQYDVLDEMDVHYLEKVGKLITTILPLAPKGELCK